MKYYSEIKVRSKTYFLVYICLRYQSYFLNHLQAIAAGSTFFTHSTELDSIPVTKAAELQSGPHCFSCQTKLNNRQTGELDNDQSLTEQTPARRVFPLALFMFIFSLQQQRTVEVDISNWAKTQILYAYIRNMSRTEKTDIGNV